MTLPPRTSSSPSSPSRTSTPGIGRPIEGAWRSSMGTTAAGPVSSLMPPTSHSGMPPAAQNSCTSGRHGARGEWHAVGGVGAEPHFIPLGHPPPLRREALGHVREGKVADERLRLDRPEALNGLERPDDVVV